MVPIKEIRPASQEEIDQAPFVFRKRGEKETERKKIAREVVEIIKENPGATISFTEAEWIVEVESFASLVRSTARREEGLEVQTVIIRDDEPGNYTLVLRKLSETDTP